MKKAAELVFIPAPGMGHLVPTVEAAKLLINLDDTLSIIVLIIKATFKSKITDYVQSLTSTPSFSHRIRFIDLPQPEDELITKDLSVAYFLTTYIENHKPQVKEAVTTAITSSSNSVLAGFVIDMFCTSMIDVANEFGVPSYLFFTSGISILNFMFYVHEQNLDTTALKGSDAKLDFPGFLNPLPSKVLPSTFLEKEYLSLMVDMAKRFGDTKGIMVNSFQELESHALDSLSHARNIPPIYPVGPILNLKGDGHDQSDSSESDIMKWLDDQPLSSVVFLCFGSMGNLGEDQVKEIACALEQSGHRFLWSLRKPQPKGTILSPSDYSSNLNEVLPNGFLDRTAEIGKVIGWAPQVKILSHPAIGGFVSHCGWNSTLEGIWFGVPIAAWPLFAEQQWNAFQLVVELGLAVEIKMDYRNENEVIVSAEEIKRGIMGVMERDSGVRKRMKEMSEMSRSASVMGGGSSHSSLRRFISHVTDNGP